MDSIYKGYPFGSLILWVTSEQLRTERQLGPFELPEPKENYPISYVLDGQQRVTSIFGTFQTDLQPVGDEKWPTVYFDLEGTEESQDTKFHVFDDQEDVDETRYFPINTFFDTVAYRKATTHLTDEQVAKVDTVQERFKEAKIPVLEFKTENRSQVAVVFERVNRLGIKLDTVQLLSAWTWSDDFDLETQFAELAEELEPFGFDELGEDSDILLRCCAAIISGSESIGSLVSISGKEVRKRFPELVEGLKGSIDFLRSEFGIVKYENLPTPLVLIPLSVFFANSGGKDIKMKDHQRDKLSKWFWRSVFSRRYRSDTNRKLNSDIREIEKLKSGETSELGNFDFELKPSYFLERKFNKRGADTKTFVLQLVNADPVSFVSGKKVDTGKVLAAYNRSEFHHLMPQAYMKQEGFDASTISSLANFAIISASDNRLLGGTAPSIYRSKMPHDRIEPILDHALCPLELFDDEPGSFLTKRAQKLAENAMSLMGFIK